MENQSFFESLKLPSASIACALFTQTLFLLSYAAGIIPGNPSPETAVLFVKSIFWIFVISFIASLLMFRKFILAQTIFCSVLVGGSLLIIIHPFYPFIEAYL